MKYTLMKWQRWQWNEKIVLIFMDCFLIFQCSYFCQEEMKGKKHIIIFRATTAIQLMFQKFEASTLKYSILDFNWKKAQKFYQLKKNHIVIQETEIIMSSLFVKEESKILKIAVIHICSWMGTKYYNSGIVEY